MQLHGVGRLLSCERSTWIRLTQLVKSNHFYLSSATVTLQDLREPWHRRLLSTHRTLWHKLKFTSNVSGLTKKTDKFPKQVLTVIRRDVYKQHRLITERGSPSRWPPLLKLWIDDSILLHVACLNYFCFSSLEKKSTTEFFSKILSCKISSPVLPLWQIDEEHFNNLPCWFAVHSFCGVYYHFALKSTENNFCVVRFYWFLCCEFYCLIVMSLNIILSSGAGLFIFFYKSYNETKLYSIILSKSLTRVNNWP